MNQLEFFEWNFRKEIINCQRRLVRAEKKLEWLMAIEELRNKAELNAPSGKRNEQQLKLFA